MGGLSADPLLLSTPILFALAATLVILRFLPYLYRFFAWLTYDRFPLSIASTLRYVSRTVGPAARLTILLMLGAALGTFAASYADTVELSLEERIEYDNGVEFRVELGESGYSTANGVRDRLGPIEGVEGIASIHRSKVSAGRSIGTTTSVTILGLEPKAAVEMMWFREDMSLMTFEELIGTIDVPPVGRGVGIPRETETLRVWVRMGEGETDQSFWLRVRDGDGRYHTAGVLAMPAAGSPWTAMDIDFQKEIVGSGAAPPYSLHSITMSEPFGLFVSEPATVYFDAVTAIQPDGRELIIEDFENRRWLEFVQRRGTGDEIEFEQDEDPISGEYVLAFRPGIGQSPGLRAAHFADPSFCTNTRCTVPTIVSADFAERQRLEVGDRYPLRLDSVIVTARVASIVELFPTLRPDTLSFIVADYDALFHMGIDHGAAPDDHADRGLAGPDRRPRVARGGQGGVEPSPVRTGQTARSGRAAGRQRTRSADNGGRLGDFAGGLHCDLAAVGSGVPRVDGGVGAPTAAGDGIAAHGWRGQFEHPDPDLPRVRNHRGHRIGAGSVVGQPDLVAAAGLPGD